MKKSLIVASVAVSIFAITAQAGLASGACPNVFTMPWIADMINPIGHNLLYMDSTLYSYLGMFEKFIPAGTIPNTTCLDLGHFGYTNSQYQGEFVNQTNPLALKELFFDAATGTQVAYDCIDSTKAAALVQYYQSKLGIVIPTSTVNRFLTLLTASHFDVIFILSSQTTISTPAKSAVTNAVRKQLPKFSFSQLYGFNMIGC